MFCDLIGSTSLAARTEPEDLGELLRDYQSRVGTAADQFGGHIALYVGDGVLIHFGWPESREADAERAVRRDLQWLPRSTRRLFAAKTWRCASESLLATWSSAR
jgi:class 3 adenylate cyclase